MRKAGKVFVPNTHAFKDSQNPEGVPRERVLMHLQISAEHPADEDIDRKSRLFLFMGFITPFIAEELRLGRSSRTRETNWMDVGRCLSFCHQHFASCSELSCRQFAPVAGFCRWVHLPPNTFLLCVFLAANQREGEAVDPAG